MKFSPLVGFAAVLAFVSIAESQVTRTSADTDGPVPVEIAILQTATLQAREGNLWAAWETLAIVETPRGRNFSAPPAQLGWRVAAVAGALRNSGEYELAEIFARFALQEAWFDKSRALAKEERGDIAYWCAWLAAEILDDRISALTWIERAAGDMPDSERIANLRTRLAAADREFPRR
jgi:hypothetical protein